VCVCEWKKTYGTKNASYNKNAANQRPQQETHRLHLAQCELNAGVCQPQLVHRLHQQRGLVVVTVRTLPIHLPRKTASSKVSVWS
jgi:hypothetical protein